MKNTPSNGSFYWADPGVLAIGGFDQVSAMIWAADEAHAKAILIEHGFVDKWGGFKVIDEKTAKRRWTANTDIRDFEYGLFLCAGWHDARVVLSSLMSDYE